MGVARWIEEDHDQLEELETEHREALQDLQKLRERRDAEGPPLLGKVVRVRLTFEDAFGQGTAVPYLGLDPGIGQVASEELRRYARSAVRILVRPDFETPKPLVEGVWENPLSYAQQIRTHLEPFEATLEAIRAQKMVVEKTLKRKTEMLKKLNRRLTWATRFFESIFRLAGLDFHADRLRTPNTSRPSPDPLEEPIGDLVPDPVEDPPPATEGGPPVVAGSEDGGGSPPAPVTDEPGSSEASG